jgi:hypothetical protein
MLGLRGGDRREYGRAERRPELLWYPVGNHSPMLSKIGPT